MIKVDERERIRRAYFVEHRGIRWIARHYHHSRDTVRQALASAEPAHYTLSTPRPAPVLGAYHARLDELLAENEKLPRKQRYTTGKMLEQLRTEGYTGSASSVRTYVAAKRREHRHPEVFLPLEFDPGKDAQVDWGEAEAIIAGEQITVQVFVMRLSYSRRIFVMAFPAQKQEAFFAGHVAAFQHFGGVPHRLSYDNLGTAVRILKGRKRQEQDAFVLFRSHYLFDSHFCTPGQGHEKGGVEHGVGYARRNFMVPLPNVPSWEVLNAQLLAACLRDDTRQVEGQPHTIGTAWALEQPHLRPLPDVDYRCCVTVPVVLNGYSQVTYETVQYSVPVDAAAAPLVLRAYPFAIEVLQSERLIARHARSYGHKTEVFDPLHYLPLLEQRPGAFEYAKPLRQWRAQWPPVYEQLLARLRAQAEEGQAIPEFVRILRLLREHAPALVERAVAQALAFGSVHLAGVQLCLHQLEHPETLPAALDLSQHPQLAAVAQVGTQSVDLQAYEQLLCVPAATPVHEAVPA